MSPTTNIDQSSISKVGQEKKIKIKKITKKPANYYCFHHTDKSNPLSNFSINKQKRKKI